LTLRNFERLSGALESRQVTQKVVDEFVLKRAREVGRSTPNKDIRNLHAFINWGKEQKYFNHKLKLKQLKEEDRPVKSLSTVQVQKLLHVAKDYPNIRMPLLLVLGTALRRGDAEAIKIEDVDFANNSITTRGKKRKKAMGSRPVPEVIMKQIDDYITTLPGGQETLISDRLSQRQWNRVRGLAGLPDLKFHDLHKDIRFFPGSTRHIGSSNTETTRTLVAESD
jgi:integrase